MRFNLSIHINYLKYFFFQSVGRYHLPNAEDWDIVKGLSLTENIQLLLHKWKSREKNPVSGVGFSTALLKSRSFLLICSYFLGIGAVFGGWGEVDCASCCTLLCWEHLENFTACICEVTVFAFSNSLTF